ncbi:MAG TPA: endonuclease domain-containing protein [Candidatus Acidoferrum sp.]|nr:endonuclease domain-containing protein [Candidatus Acidoferrum sp.]
MNDRIEVEIPAAQVERTVKLARTAMRAYAHKLLKEQDGKCPLCGKEIDLTIKGEGVIDHDHDSGRIRGLLHRSCNAAEGKIANAAARWGAKSSAYSDIITYLQRVVNYLQKPAHPVIYPMHKTADEKKDDRNRKAREARAAVKAKRELLRQQRQGNQ